MSRGEARARAGRLRDVNGSPRYDPEADAIYVALRDHCGQVRSRNEGDWRRVADYNEAGEPVGVELLAVSTGIDLDRLPEAEAIGAAIASFPRFEARP